MKNKRIIIILAFVLVFVAVILLGSVIFSLKKVNIEFRNNDVFSTEQQIEICKNEVYCMPLGENLGELEKNAPKVAKFCVKNGYNYSDRLHIRISQR